MRIVSDSHPWHTECHCFETAVFDLYEDIPDGWIIWLEGDNGDTAAYRRVIKNPGCACHQCKLTEKIHTYLDSKGW